MPPKKAAAAAAAHGASRRAGGVVIRASDQERVRAVLQRLHINADAALQSPPPPAADGPPLPPAAAVPVDADEERRLNGIYTELLVQGFQRQHIQAALSAACQVAAAAPAAPEAGAAAAGATLASALDWLLMHLPPADLPWRYADQGTAGRAADGTVDVRHKAPASSRAPSADAAKQRQAAAEAAVEARAAEEEQRRAEEERRRAEEEQRRAEEAAAQRAWIMQYAQEDSSSSAGSASGYESDTESEARCGAWGRAGHKGETSAASSLGDWQTWGQDPKEVEQRRQQRKRAALPPEQRLVLIASELAAARRGAARAKAAGDKAQQKECGQQIGKLRAEATEIGMSAGQLEEAVAAAAAAAEPEDEPEEEQAVGRMVEPAATPNQGPTEGLGAAVSSHEGSGSASATPRSADGEGGNSFDLFGCGDGLASEAALESIPRDLRSRVAARVARAVAAAARHLQAQAAGGGGKQGGGSGKKGKGGGKPLAAAPQGPQAQQPKSLLQQHCQKQGLPAPRYDKLPHGGGRLEGGGYRYSVTVDSSAGGRGPRRKQQQQQGPRKYQLREQDDGWERIEDAQGAAATRALFELAYAGCDAGAEPTPEADCWLAQLPEQFQELWVVWEEEGEAGLAAAAGAETPEEAEARQAFVRQLLAEVHVRAAASAEHQEEAPGSVLSGGWEAQLMQSLSAGSEGASSAPQQTPAQREESERMRQQLAAWRDSEEGRRWSVERGRLPVFAIRQQLLEALAVGDVVVVGGETGSGKTTQVPQFLLEAAAEAGEGAATSIVCTQPRRLAAISVAERVAAERGEPAPGASDGRVGYHVRLDAAATAATRLLFCTTGILLRRMASDPGLAGISHVVVDEVHERTLQGDFLLALLRDLAAIRRRAGRPLKVVLMSATLDSELYCPYFGGAPALCAQGRTFPVEQRFLEDAYELTGYQLDPDSPAALRPHLDRRQQRKLAAAAGSRHAAAVRAGWGDAEADDGQLAGDGPLAAAGYSPRTRRNLGRVDEDRIDFELLEALVGWIDETQEPGAVLVFLPGMGEINALAFRVPPPSVRKVVVATNIAETSLTIEDVVYVVDSARVAEAASCNFIGKLKERRHDPSRGMSLLVEDWARARVARQEALFGSLALAFERRMRKQQQPEMVRVPLEELVVQIHLLRLGRAAPFLAKVLQPPPDRAVAAAVAALQEVGALTGGEELTPLGHHLAALPVDSRVGKLLLLGAALGCLAPALSIAACLSYKPPFLGGPGGGGGEGEGGGARAARAALAALGSGTLAAGQQSDHLLLAAAVAGWLAARASGGMGAARDYARRHCLSMQALDMLADMRAQFAAMLADIGFVTRGSGAGGQRARWADDPSAPHNHYATHPAVVKAVLVAALYPSIAGE
eukprot:scaffold1.g5373.t1